MTAPALGTGRLQGRRALSLVGGGGVTSAVSAPGMSLAAFICYIRLTLRPRSAPLDSAEPARRERGAAAAQTLGSLSWLCPTAADAGCTAGAVREGGGLRLILQTARP